jgi:hypothetical protein
MARGDHLDRIEGATPAPVTFENHDPAARLHAPLMIAVAIPGPGIGIGIGPARAPPSRT